MYLCVRKDAPIYNRIYCDYTCCPLSAPWMKKWGGTKKQSPPPICVPDTDEEEERERGKITCFPNDQGGKKGA